MITVNLDKAKSIAHDARRTARAEEFKPLDVQATIPAQAVAAEASRQIVRDKYAVMQSAIDAAVDVSVLKTIMETMQ